MSTLQLQKRTGFFRDGIGKLSLTRLQSHMSWWLAALLSGYSIIANREMESWPIILTWVVASFGPKVIQKFAESKIATALIGEKMK